jgi:hypothetical protein
MKWVTFMGLAMLLGISSPTQAAFVLSLENVVVTAGQQAVVGVFLSSDSSQLLTGYILPIEVGGNGRGLPSGLSFPGDPAAETSTWAAVGITQLGSDITPPIVRNYEGLFFDAMPLAGSPIQLTTTPVQLFSLLVNTHPGLPDGTVFPVSITDSSFPTSQFSITTISGTGGTSTTVHSIAAGGSALAGSITINAVPEPGSLAFLTSTGVLGGAYFRFRQRSSPAKPNRLA